jgi:hypothetical protein
MTTQKILFFALMIGSFQLFSQTQFQKKMGTGANEIMYDILKLSDGYVLAGSKYNAITQNDMWVVRIDFDGNIIWSKTFGSTKDDKAYSITRTDDNCFILAGYSKGYITTGADSSNVCIAKIDSNGVWQWSKIYGGNSIDIAYSVKKTLNGGLIICGYSESFGIGQQDMYVIRTDSAGNLLWEKSFGTVSKDSAFLAIETSTGDFVVVGHSNGIGAGTFTNVTKLY